MPPDETKPSLRFKKLRIAWSVAVMSAVIFVPPALETLWKNSEAGLWVRNDWLLGLIAFVLLGAAWLPRQFSLGEILIITTLIAVVLGLATWATAK